MLVNELRKEIEKYEKKDLQNIIVELYKKIPKVKKEEYNIDEYIKNINIETKSKKEEIDFDTLEKRITYFLELVDEGLYARSNRIVSKKERSSWRFNVKQFYKELNNILPNSEDGYEATMLLIKLFTRLSRGTSTLLFSNWDTFKAIGISQCDYYDMIIKRLLYNGYTSENLNKCINLLSVDKDSNDLSIGMYYTFVACLKTNETKELAIELLKNNVLLQQEEIKKITNTTSKYYKGENINNTILIILELYISLCEVDEGIKYYHKNYKEHDEEVKEYVLLEVLEENNLIGEWIKEYNKNFTKVKFRESIIEKYKKFKKL